MTIDGYVKSVERWTVGSRTEKKARGSELRDHLEAAEQNGDLPAALSRLGSPRDAARAFGGQGHEVPRASVLRRLVAQVADLGVFLLPAYATYLVSTPSFRIHLSTSPLWEREQPVVLLGIAAALWWAVGLTVLEWRTGRTPGKALLGIRARSVDGTALAAGQATVRRLPLIFGGPLALVDAVFILIGGRRQRAFDRVASTIVTRDTAPARAPKLRWVTAAAVLLVGVPVVTALTVRPWALENCRTTPPPVHVRTTSAAETQVYWNFPGLWNKTAMAWGCEYHYSDGSGPGRLSPGGERL
ncbi:MAG: RDD family protein [Gemmatimonadales bacterium]